MKVMIKVEHRLSVWALGTEAWWPEGIRHHSMGLLPGHCSSKRGRKARESTLQASQPVVREGSRERNDWDKAWHALCLHLLCSLTTAEDAICFSPDERRSDCLYMGAGDCHWVKSRAPSLMSWVQFPGPTWWKERTPERSPLTCTWPSRAHHGTCTRTTENKWNLILKL